MHSFKKGQAPSGFTIVELLIVIVVIGILAAITLVAYNGITNRARDSASLSNAQQVGKKITVHSLSNSDTLPADLATIGITNSSDTTYQYTRNTASTPDTFCVTATSGGISAHSAGTNTSVNNPTAGPCAGHTGTSPTTLAGGATCPTGYIVVPGSSLYSTNAFCVMKYEAKNDGSGNPVSTTTGTPWVSISQTSAITEASTVPSCTTCHLITEAEWLTIAQNVMSVGSNWSVGSVGSGFIYSGHNDSVPANSLTATTDDNDGYNGTGQTTGSNQRRTLTLTNGEVIWDLAGNVREWTQGTTAGAGNQPAPSGGGYTWREWTTTGLLPGNFPHTFPTYATGNNWNSTQGVGQLYSSNTEAGTRAFLRGGNWYDGGYAGLLALLLSYSSGDSSAGFGFRVSR